MMRGCDEDKDMGPQYISSSPCHLYKLHEQIEVYTGRKYDPYI